MSSVLSPSSYQHEFVHYWEKKSKSYLDLCATGDAKEEITKSPIPLATRELRIVP